jgi:hypothetical protein
MAKKRKTLKGKGLEGVEGGRSVRKYATPAVVKEGKMRRPLVTGTNQHSSGSCSAYEHCDMSSGSGGGWCCKSTASQ